MKYIAYIILSMSIIFISCGKKPTANFTWRPNTPKAGEKVVFTNTSTDAKKYDWNLGNIKISSDKNPKNIYDAAGNYIVDLTAHNGLKSSTKTYTITVIP